MEFSISNRGNTSLVIDYYSLYQVFNCATGDTITPNIPATASDVRSNLLDGTHLSIAPGVTEQVKFISAKFSDSGRVIKLAKALNTGLMVRLGVFIRLENIENFEEVTEGLEFDLSDKVEIDGSNVKLPPNTQAHTFDIPVEWTSDGLSANKGTIC